MAFVMESLLVFRFVRAFLLARRRRRRTGYPEGGAVPPDDDDSRPTGGRGHRCRSRGRRHRLVGRYRRRVCACERAPRVCARSRVYAAAVIDVRDALDRWYDIILLYRARLPFIVLYTCAPRLTSVRLTSSSVLCSAIARSQRTVCAARVSVVGVCVCVGGRLVRVCRWSVCTRAPRPCAYVRVRAARILLRTPRVSVRRCVSIIFANRASINRFRFSPISFYLFFPPSSFSFRIPFRRVRNLFTQLLVLLLLLFSDQPIARYHTLLYTEK